MSLQEKIRAASDAKVERVNVPEWGFDVWMRCPSMERRSLVETSIYNGEKRDTEHFHARWVACCLCEENGAYVYDDPVAGAKELAGKSSAAVLRLYQHAKRLALLTDALIEELGKN